MGFWTLLPQSKTTSNFMKYIIIELNGIESPVIFPPWVQHSSAAKWCLGTLLSAGFIRRDEGGRLYVWGESKSLKLKSRPVEDLDLILRAFEFQPVGA